MPFDRFSYDSEIFNYLNTIRSIRGRKFIDNLMKDGIVYETDLMEFLKCTKSDVIKIFSDLSVNGNIVTRWRDKETKVPCYTLHPRFFNLAEKCKMCFHQQNDKKKISGKEIKYINCMMVSDGILSCVHDYTRTNYNLMQVLKETHEEVEIEEINRENIIESNIEKKITEWKINDYAQFYREQCNKYMPEMIFDNAHTVRRNLRTVIDSLKQAFEGKWRRMLKLYIRKQIEIGKSEGYFVSSSKLSQGAAIAKFVNKYKDEEEQVEFCDDKGIYCSYMKKRCQLIKNGMKCTVRIRKKMKKLYN